MRYDLREDDGIKAFMRYAQKLINKGAALVELKEGRGGQTSSSAYLHILIAYFAEQYGCSVTTARETIFKLSANPAVFVRYATCRDGQTVLDPLAIKDIPEDTLNECIDRFKTYARAKGIYLPDKEDRRFMDWAANYAEEHERNKKADA